MVFSRMRADTRRRYRLIFNGLSPGSTRSGAGSQAATNAHCAVLDTKTRCYICNAMARRRDDRNEMMRRYVLRQIRAGALSVTGAAFVAGVSKMTVSRWCAQARIDPAAAEHRRWLDLRARAQRLVDGAGVRDDVELEHHPRSGPSKEALRRQADWAMRRAGLGEAEEPGEQAAVSALAPESPVAALG
jgi:hypothetical protein